MSSLTPAEITDLYLTVQRVGRIVEKAYGAEALTVSTQYVPTPPLSSLPDRSRDMTEMIVIDMFAFVESQQGRSSSRPIRPTRARPYPPSKIHRFWRGE